MKTLKLKFELHQRVYYFEKNDVNRLVEGEIVNIKLGELNDISNSFFPEYYVMRHKNYEMIKSTFGINGAINGTLVEQKFERELAKTPKELIEKLFHDIINGSKGLK